MQEETYNLISAKQCEALNKASARKDSELVLHVLDNMQKLAVLHHEGRVLRLSIYDLWKKIKEKRKCVKNWKKHGFATCVKRSLENLKLSKTVTISLFVQDAESM